MNNNRERAVSELLSSSSSSSSTFSSDPPAVDLAQRASPPVAPHANTSSTVRQCNGTDTLLRFRASLATFFFDRFSAENENVLVQPCCLFRVPPQFCKSVLRQCLRLAFELVLCASGSSPAHWSRAWKLLLFARRMLLHGPRGGIRPEKAVLLARFQRGEWHRCLTKPYHNRCRKTPNCVSPMLKRLLAVPRIWPT